MSALLSSAPHLETQSIDQIAALPLGGRVKLDPWSNRLEMMKTKTSRSALTAREDAVRSHTVLSLSDAAQYRARRNGIGPMTKLCYHTFELVNAKI